MQVLLAAALTHCNTQLTRHCCKKTASIYYGSLTSGPQEHDPICGRVQALHYHMLRRPLPREGMLREIPPSCFQQERCVVQPENLRPEHDRLIRKLESIVDLSGDDTKALLRLPLRLKSLGADQDVVREGDGPSECCLVLDGFVCRYKILPSGRRQIMSFHTPGDMPDLQSLHLHVMDHSVGTLVPSRVAFIPHQDIRDVCLRFPNLAAAFWRDTLIDAAIFREWMAGIGRRSAYQRIAHLICEMEVRSRAVGLSHDHTFEMPVTQEEIGDALGLSTVHVNRVLKALREDGLITFRGTTVSIHDWEALTIAGEFDPAYLHVRRQEAA